VPVIDSDESFSVVDDDITNGLGDIFEPISSRAVSVAQAFRDTETITNTEITAVPWTYQCRHVGDFNGIFPTGRNLEIQGVTFVDNRGGRTLLHRYVDWAGVFTQLGMAVSARVSVTEEEYAFGRDRLGLAAT
jgi:hypothetical protein